MLQAASRSKNNSSSPTTVVKYFKLLHFSNLWIRIKSHNHQLVQPSEAPPTLFFCSFMDLKYSAQNTHTHTHTNNTKPVILSHFSYHLPIYLMVGRDCSVGIATRYGLEGPGSHWGRDFPQSSRPAMGSTQPPIEWVPVLSWGWSGRGVALNTHPI